MSGKSLYRNGQAVLKADTAAVDAQRAATLADRRATANKAKDYLRLSRGDIDGQLFVLVFGFGWRRVISVNEKTVTVEEPYAWDGSARYPFARIVEVRS